MADPATQFQQAGLNIPYQFTPTQYHPGAVNVPSETGALLARAGETAMAGGKMLLQSPLNPAVRAQQQVEVANAQQALSHMKWLHDLGPKAHWLQGMSPDGRPYYMAPAEIRDPSLASMFGLPGGGGGGGGGGDGSTSTSTTDGSAPVPAAPPTPREQAAPPKKTTQVTLPASSLFASTPSTPPPALPGGFQGPSQAQTTAGVQEALSRNQFASTEQGVPAGYQPPGQGAPQAQAEPGGIMDQYAQDYAAGHAQGQEARRQADLSNWQQTTQTEPMTADDAMKYIRRKTTLAQDATYLQHGGPNNEPAFAFHMKGGGVNTVPVSQMLRDGAGPTIAAQNTSAMLSQSDKLNQQQQNALVAPPPMPTDQGAQQQPAAPVGPQPPPAPGQQPMLNLAVPSKGGLPLEYLSASAAPGPTGTPPAPPPPEQPAQPTYGFHSPVTTAAPNISPAQTAALTAQANKNKDTNDFTGQDAQGNQLTWHRDTDKKSDGYGRLYLSLPPTAGNYYDHQRFYMGSDGYHLFETPESFQREKMDYWIERGAPGITRQRVAGMSAEEMRPWLRQMWNDQHFSTSPATQGINATFDGLEDFHNTLQEIEDGVKTSANFNAVDRAAVAINQAGKDIQTETPGDKTQAALVQKMSNSAQQIKSLANMPDGPDKQKAIAQITADLKEATGNAASMQSGEVSPLKTAANAASGLLNWLSGAIAPDTMSTVRSLERKISHAQQLIDTHPEWQLAPGKAGGQEMPNVNLWGAQLGLPNIPASNVLQDVFRGIDQNEKLKNLDDLRRFADNRYKSLVETAQTQWQRFDDKHVANTTKYDEANRQSTSAPTPTPSPTPSPTPFQISSWKTGEAELAKAGFKKGEGKPFTGPDGKTHYY